MSTAWRSDDPEPWYPTMLNHTDAAEEHGIHQQALDRLSRRRQRRPPHPKPTPLSPPRHRALPKPSRRWAGLLALRRFLFLFVGTCWSLVRLLKSKAGAKSEFSDRGSEMWKTPFEFV